MNTINGHSGYNFPWAPFSCIPFQTSAAYHDYHHYEGGNYSGNFEYWDTLMGWNEKFFDLSAERFEKIDREASGEGGTPGMAFTPTGEAEEEAKKDQ